MRVTLKLAALVCTVGLVGGFLACGGGGDDRASTVDDGGRATPVERSESPSRNPTAEPARNDITQDELAGALLTVNDLPTGWATSAPDEADDDDDFCGFQSTDVSTHIASLEANFQQATTGPFLFHALQLHESGNAKNVTNGFLEATRSCPGWNVTDDDGTQTEWKLAALSFPKIGDETIAVRLSSTTILGVFELDYIVMRRGDVLNVVAYGAIGFAGIDSAQTEEFVRLADAKVSQLD